MFALYSQFFIFDSLAQILSGLIGFVGIIIGAFAFRHLKGDHRYTSFYFKLIVLVALLILMVSANHLFIFILTWGGSNALLVRLMVHKTSWKQAVESGKLAAKFFLGGFAALSLAFLLIYQASGTAEISSLKAQSFPPFVLWSVGGLLAVVACVQSAAWPFHRWLLSSLNAPTPVSALMHAGLVNGGGFLLIRFSPLFLKGEGLLNVLFIIGSITAVLGTYWKLIQPDAKRMLACSTMAQMGFMLVECGLGLFPLALAHLCWHGLFKAHLFLNLGSMVHAAPYAPRYPAQKGSFIASVFCGVLGGVSYIALTDSWGLLQEGSFLIVGVITIALIHLATNIFHYLPLRKVPLIGIVMVVIGALYGGSTLLFEQVFSVAENVKKPLSLLHLLGLTALTIPWLFHRFYSSLQKLPALKYALAALYVKGMNASQPHPKTVTTHRNDYSYQ